MTIFRCALALVGALALAAEVRAPFEKFAGIHSLFSLSVSSIRRFRGFSIQTSSPLSSTNQFTHFARVGRQRDRENLEPELLAGPKTKVSRAKSMKKTKATERDDDDDDAWRKKTAQPQPLSFSLPLSTPLSTLHTQQNSSSTRTPESPPRSPATPPRASPSSVEGPRVSPPPRPSSSSATRTSSSLRVTPRSAASASLSRSTASFTIWERFRSRAPTSW